MPASLKTSCRIIQLSYKKIKRLIGYSANRAYSVSLYCLQMLLKLRFCVVESADNRPIAAFFALFVPLKRRFYKIFGFVFCGLIYLRFAVILIAEYFVPLALCVALQIKKAVCRASCGRRCF